MGLEPNWSDETIGNDDNLIESIRQNKVAIVFEVENVDTSFNEFQSKGVIFIKEPIDHLDWGIRTAHFHDSDGNLIEINCPIKSQAMGILSISHITSTWPSVVKKTISHRSES